VRATRIRVPGVRSIPALALGLVVVVAALALRLVSLGGQQLFRDEAASWYLAGHSVTDLLSLSSNGTFPPLYPLLLKGAMALLGDSEAALRSISVIAGLATIGVTWRWARDAIGPIGGLVAATLVTLSPAMVAADRNARMYSLETLCSTAAWWLAWALVSRGAAWSRRRRLSAAIGLALAVAGELWTMSLGVPMAGLQLVFVAIAVLWLRARVAVLAAVAIVVGTATFLPWLPNLVTTASNGQGFWTAVPDVGSIPDTLKYWLVGRLDGGFWLIVALGAMAAVAGLVACGSGRLAGGGSDGNGRLTALAPAFGMILVPALWLYSQVHSIYDARYLGAVFPGFSIAAGAGVEWMIGRARAADASRGLRLGRMASVAAGLATSVAIALGSGVFVAESTGNKDLEPAREVVSKLSELARPGDVVITLNAQTWFPLRYYMRDGAVEQRLGSSPYDWHRASAVYFTGWREIDPSALLEPDAVASAGWRASTGLAPGGVIWLVTLVDPDYEFSGFAPLATGELTEIARIDVPGANQIAQIRGLVPASP
jgi:mannosyltransferase